MGYLAKILVSVLFVALALAHVFLPSITIDTITLILLVLAIIPWLLPYISGFEIPGVVKITLPETKAATDKLKGDRIIRVPTGQLEIQEFRPEVVVTRRKEDSFEFLRRVYETNPNLALVGFRIEIERRIVRLAELFGIGTERVGLQRLVRELVNRGVLSASAASGLVELIALGNQAAHGADVTPEAAEWVLDIGPSILMQLEDIDLPNETE
jgi:hypothetical protein